MGEGLSQRARILLKVRPKAKRSAVRKWQRDTLYVDVAAPPVDGKANDELLRLLAEQSGVRRANIRIIRGESTPNKFVEFTGISLENLLLKLP